MAQTNYVTPQIVVPNPSVGTDWLNPNNILLVDGDFAVSGGSTQILEVGNFPINLDIGDVVTNIYVRIKGYRGSFNTTLDIYAVDDTSGTPISYQLLPSFQGFNGTNTTYTLGPTLFATTWTVNQINNLKIKLIADGELYLDAVEVSVVFTPAVTTTVYYNNLSGVFQVGEAITGSNGATGVVVSDSTGVISLTNVTGVFVPGITITGGTSLATATVIPAATTGLIVTNEFVQGQKFQLARSMSNSATEALLTSFNYPDGSPIQYADFHGPEAFITIDQGVPGYEENCRITAIDHDYNGTGFVRLNFTSLANRGLAFKYPYTSDPALIVGHSGTAEVVISNSAPFYDRFIKKTQIGALVSGPIAIEDEGVALTSAVQSIDFVGAGVTASVTSPNNIRVNIPGGGGGGITLQTDGVSNGDQTLLNLVSGTNITLTDNGTGSVTIDATGGGGGGSLEVQQNGTTIETNVTTINITGNANVTNPSAGVVDIDIFSSLSGSNISEQFDDFVYSDIASISGGSTGGGGISGNFNFAQTGGGGTPLTPFSEDDHPGIVRLQDGSNHYLQGFYANMLNSLTSDGLLNYTDDFDIQVLARLNYNIVSTNDIQARISLLGVPDEVTIIFRSVLGVPEVAYNIGGGIVTTAVAFPATTDWFNLRFTMISGVLTVTLDSAIIYTGNPGFTDSFGIRMEVPNAVTSTCQLDVDWVRTRYRSLDADSGTEKKVGVGAVSDINWYNIQIPFIGPNGVTSTFSVWDLNNISGTYPGGSMLLLGNGNYFNCNSSYSGLLPDFAAQDRLNFDSGKQAIFQITVVTDDLALGGVGFEAFSSSGLISAQGTNLLSVGFVRAAGGQWYARSATGAAFTEVPITITNGTNVLRCEYDPANAIPQARFYVNGILLSTITTNIPSAVATDIGFTCGNDATSPIQMAGAPSFAVEI